MMKRIYIICFFIFCHSFFSQTKDNIDKQYEIAITLAKEGKREEAKALLNKVLQASIESNDSKGKAYGYYIKSQLSYYERDFSNSIQYMNLSLQEDFAHQNYFLQTNAYHILGQNYVTIGIDDEAIKAYKKMAISAKKITSPTEAIYKENIAYNDLASIYANIKNNLDSAFYYSNKVYKNLYRIHQKNDNLNTLLAKSALNISQLYNKKNMPDSVQHYMKKSLEYSSQKATVSTKDDNKNKHKAVINLANQLYENAKIYNDSLLKDAEKASDLENLEVAYKIKSILSEKTKDKQAHEDLKKYVKISDSLNNLDRRNIKKPLIGIIETQHKKIEQESRNSRYLWGTVFFMILLLISGTYYFKRYNEKKKLEKKKILSEKQSEISKLESKVNAAFDELVTLAKNHSPNFLARLQEVYPDFCKKIVKLDPEIQNSELAFCGYILLNFSTKEIANYTFVTPKSVQMRKYRLRKKFNIPSDEDIYIWMKNIDKSI